MRAITKFLTALAACASLAACGSEAGAPAETSSVQGDPARETTPARANPAPAAVAPDDDGGERFVLVMLGDSLTAGFGLDDPDLLVDGLATRIGEVDGRRLVIRNAGVSGETTADGLRRFDWSTPEEADGVLIQLGANDMFQGRDPALVRADLAAILELARARGLWVGLVGMRAPLNAGLEYRAAFDAVYPDLARRFCAPLYPWYFQGLVDAETGLREELFLPDGVHPTADGIEVVADHLAPWLERALAGVEDPC